MCYKKPGPRCSAWAKKRLDDLEDRGADYSDPQGYEKYQAELRQAQLDCDATPGGQRYLRARIAQGDRDNMYSERLENGIKLRKMQLAAIKAAEAGDYFNHEIDEPFHTTQGFPASFTERRMSWEFGDYAERVEEYMRASDNAMKHLTPDEQSGLWWITSDGGPFLNSQLAEHDDVSGRAIDRFGDSR